MHISRVQLVNYRNFERADAVFKKGVNTIIGENGVGKDELVSGHPAAARRGSIAVDLSSRRKRLSPRSQKLAWPLDHHQY